MKRYVSETELSDGAAQASAGEPAVVIEPVIAATPVEPEQKPATPVASEVVKKADAPKFEDIKPKFGFGWGVSVDHTKNRMGGWGGDRDSNPPSGGWDR